MDTWGLIPTDVLAYLLLWLPTPDLLNATWTLPRVSGVITAKSFRLAYVHYNVDSITSMLVSRLKRGRCSGMATWYDLIPKEKLPKDEGGLLCSILAIETSEPSVDRFARYLLGRTHEQEFSPNLVDAILGRPSADMLKHVESLGLLFDDLAEHAVRSGFYPCATYLLGRIGQARISSIANIAVERLDATALSFVLDVAPEIRISGASLVRAIQMNCVDILELSFSRVDLLDRDRYGRLAIQTAALATHENAVWILSKLLANPDADSAFAQAILFDLTPAEFEPRRAVFEYLVLNDYIDSDDAKQHLRNFRRFPRGVRTILERIARQ